MPLREVSQGGRKGTEARPGVWDRAFRRQEGNPKRLIEGIAALRFVTTEALRDAARNWAEVSFLFALNAVLVAAEKARGARDGKGL